jgi:hypothetical protein
MKVVLSAKACNQLEFTGLERRGELIWQTKMFLE